MTVTIAVANVNDNPVGVADAFLIPTNTMLNVVNSVLANDSDVDDINFVAILVRPPLFGEFSIDSDGTFSYRPSAGFSGVDSFAYRPSDGTSVGNEVTVSIDVVAGSNQNSSTGGVPFVQPNDRSDDSAMDENDTKKDSIVNNDLSLASGQLANVFTGHGGPGDENGTGDDELNSDIASHLTALMRLADERRLAAILDFILSVSQDIIVPLGPNNWMYCSIKDCR